MKYTIGIDNMDNWERNAILVKIAIFSSEVVK